MHFVHSSEQLAEILTKLLSHTQFASLCHKLNVLTDSSGANDSDRGASGWVKFVSVCWYGSLLRNF